MYLFKCKGGQKALAAVALSLSCSVVYPSAIHIFDEIDASLDANSTKFSKIATI